MNGAVRPWTRGAAAALAAALMAGACGSGGATSANKPRPALSGSLTVFAAASLTEAFSQEKATLARSAPALILTYGFAGSQTLAQQIIQGARADLFASADDRTMQRLVDAKLVEAPRVFARNQLEIVVAPGNPRHVSGLRDLARPDLVVVLEDPTVPAGSYSQQALAKAEVRVRPRSLELDVKSALSKVTSGEADAAIVYASDVQAAGSKASGVAIPAGQNVVATYPIAVVRTSSNHAGAAAFVQEVLSGSGQAALEAHGFLPAS